MKTYLTRDNGGRPFQVQVISKSQVNISKLRQKSNGEYDLILEFQDLKRIMIGESPLNAMTSRSGGHGPEFKGNSILLQKDEKTYIFVGESIYEFEVPDGKIVTYVSPVGNSDVPYPYAVDNHGRYYLLLMGEMMVLEYIPESEREDPAGYWYQQRTFSTEEYAFYVGRKKYDFYTVCDPKEDAKSFHRLERRNGSKVSVYFESADTDRVKLTLETFHELQESARKLLKCSPLQHTVLVPRLF